MVIYRLGLPYYKEFDNFQFGELVTIKSVIINIVYQQEGETEW